ncbi:hypothetical protein Droror1_Dr00007886 [Drosera rotundifolia]
MPQRSISARNSIDSCTIQLNSWNPFSNPNPKPNPKSTHLDSDSHTSSPRFTTPKGFNLSTKRPCLADRATTSFSLSIDNIDFSKLTLFEDGHAPQHYRKGESNHSLRMIARKRRRRGSRSVSGRSSDRSVTRTGRRCSMGANVNVNANGTCSDFMMGAGGTDSSGEMFNGNGNGGGWGSDVSEARSLRRERGEGGGNGIGERENSGCGVALDERWSESGYGSEPGYRGDAEFGYGDELDEDDEDARILLLEKRFGDANMEMVGDNTFMELKNHHRGRRKKQDWKTMGTLR